MALEKTTVAYPFKGGISNKDDDKSVQPGRLLVLENATFQTPGKLRKRNGYASRSMHSAEDGTRTRLAGSGRMLATRGDELLMADETTLYSATGDTGDWIPKDALSSCIVTQQEINRDTNTQTAQDGATHAATGVQGYCWEDSSGGVRYAIVDGTTGQVVVPSTLLCATGKKPKVLAIGSSLVFIYYKTADTKLWTAVVSASSGSM